MECPVSSLASVYGLNGIPTGMIEKVEIIKGPLEPVWKSSSGRIDQCDHKNYLNTVRVFLVISMEPRGKNLMDLGFSGKINKNINFLTGINGYIYDNPVDNNKDNFTM